MAIFVGYFHSIYRHPATFRTEPIKIINFKVHDCQTGFRAFTREVAESIQINSTHTYTQEQIIKAVRQNFRIKDIPVRFLKRPGKSRLQTSAQMVCTALELTLAPNLVF